MAGLFFCFASAGGAGLFFLPGGVSATHKRLQRLFCRPCNYTATTPKSFTRLYRGISVDLTHSSAHNTAATQSAYTPPAPRRRAYRQAQHLHRYQILPTRRTLYRSAQPPYYNNVYKGSGAPLLWIHARWRSTSQTMPARRVSSYRVRIAGKCCTGYRVSSAKRSV